MKISHVLRSMGSFKPTSCVMAFCVAIVLVSGTFGCKPETASNDPGRQGAVDAKCSEKSKEQCSLVADCTMVGSQCSGTASYCAKFKGNQSTCNSSCQWESMNCVPLKNSNDSVAIGSAEYCRAYLQKTACPSTCEWGATTGVCQAIGNINGGSNSCESIKVQTSCTGTCSWINGFCQKSGGSVIPPNSVNNNCANVSMWMCLLTTGCTIPLALPPVCAPRI